MDDLRGSRGAAGFSTMAARARIDPNKWKPAKNNRPRTSVESGPKVSSYPSNSTPLPASAPGRARGNRGASNTGSCGKEQPVLTTDPTGLEQKLTIREEGRATTSRINRIVADWESIGEEADDTTTVSKASRAGRASSDGTGHARGTNKDHAAASVGIASGSASAAAALAAADEAREIALAGTVREEAFVEHLEGRPKVAQMLDDAHEHAQSLEDMLTRMRGWQTELSESASGEAVQEAEEHSDELRNEISRAGEHLTNMSGGLESSAEKMRELMKRLLGKTDEHASGATERAQNAEATLAEEREELQDEVSELEARIHQLTEAGGAAKEMLQNANKRAQSLEITARKDRRNFGAALEEMRHQLLYLERFNAALQAEDRLAHIAARDEVVMKRLQKMQASMGASATFGAEAEARGAEGKLAMAEASASDAQQEIQSLRAKLNAKNTELEKVSI